MKSLTTFEYAAGREALLGRIRRVLEDDPRFTAAWLAGSYGRGEQDAVSDLDLFVVVADEYASSLCRRFAMTSAFAPPERLALFRAAGELANIHENHNNAPPGGSFSAVLYREPAVIVDWSLVPMARAVRADETQLLFERVGLRPVALSAPLPETAADSPAPDLAERIAFFVMMAAVTAKYIVRGEQKSIAELLAFVGQVVREIDTLTGQKIVLPVNTPDPNPAAQAAHLRGLFDRVEAARKRVPVLIDPPLTERREPVEVILGLR